MATASTRGLTPKAEGSAQGRYLLLSEKRWQFLERARHNALLTIPSLISLMGHDGRTHLIEPYQGLGAMAITHLSSRMVSRMIPAGRPFMRLALSAEEMMELEGEIPEDTERALALAEQLIQGEVETADWRTSTLMSLQQLIVAGNVCEHQMLDNTIRVFRLDQFVVLRDYAGNVLEAMIEEKLTPDTLPEDVPTPTNTTGGTEAADEQVKLYTWIKRFNKEGGDVYHVHQEVNDQKVGVEIEYDLAALPWNFLRWSVTPGEDYGRAKVSEHVADLRALDNLEKAMLEMAGMASRNFIMIRPTATGVGLKNRLSKASNGSVMMGDPDSVELKSFDNTAGFQITASQVETLRQSIAKAFLLLSGGQRDAERVTATEIERDIQELEAALGGNFSTLNTQMMERRTRILIANMIDQGKLPMDVLGTEPTVLTGLEALSRERDVQRVMQVANIVQAFGEGATDVIKLNKVIGRATIGLGFADVVRTQDEIDEIQKQKAQQAQMEQMIGPAIQAASKEGK
jgi:hypothetical protein